MNNGHAIATGDRYPGGQSSRGWIAVAISILAHLLLGLWLWTLERPEATRPDLVTLEVVDRETTSIVNLLKPKTQLDGQVITLPEPEKEEIPPPDARFLSQYDTRVEKEQKTRHRRPSHRKRSRARKGVSRMDVKERKPRHQREEQKKMDQEEVALPARAPDRRRGFRGLAGLDRLLMPTLGGSPRVSSVMGSAGAGVFLSDDALLGVRDEGETTLVNSRSFKYWDFFQRVKDRVRSEWEPGTAYRSRDPHGKVYGSKDRLTVLSIVLDAKGNVLRLEVARESGLPFLDKEAMQSFRAASPFPNPPVGLADGNGRISFRFGFLLDLSSSKSRFFWGGSP